VTVTELGSPFIRIVKENNPPPRSVMGDEATGWTPATETNSLAVELVVLAVTATEKEPPLFFVLVAETIVITSGGKAVALAIADEDVDDAGPGGGHTVGAGTGAIGNGLSCPTIGGEASGGVRTFPGV
jgi:hypothetical protein